MKLFHNYFFLYYFVCNHISMGDLKVCVISILDGNNNPQIFTDFLFNQVPKIYWRQEVARFIYIEITLVLMNVKLLILYIFTKTCYDLSKILFLIDCGFQADKTNISCIKYCINEQTFCYQSRSWFICRYFFEMYCYCCEAPNFDFVYFHFKVLVSF